MLEFSISIWSTDWPSDVHSKWMKPPTRFNKAYCYFIQTECEINALNIFIAVAFAFNFKFFKRITLPFVVLINRLSCISITQLKIRINKSFHAKKVYQHFRCQQMSNCLNWYESEKKNSKVNQKTVIIGTNTTNHQNWPFTVNYKPLSFHICLCSILFCIGETFVTWA